MIDSSAFQGKKATYYTLGCKLNFSETSTFGKMLSDMGVVTVDKGEKADICLINTCSVTEVADHKCRQAIHRMARENPGAFIIVTGCYAQLESEKVSKIPRIRFKRESKFHSISKRCLYKKGNRRNTSSIPFCKDKRHQDFSSFMLEG